MQIYPPILDIFTNYYTKTLHECRGSLKHFITFGFWQHLFEKRFTSPN